MSHNSLETLNYIVVPGVSFPLLQKPLNIAMKSWCHFGAKNFPLRVSPLHILLRFYD